ncbi:PAS domain-containing sensor histidine kinase [Ideonella sp.]|uniref:PAS domain-containing sensor histidine kinase n=1 Tax=Ideonella sp. TaxID=1929293 RepID=UPI002B4681DE|nr:ATP-binding protein [Ideonella sp.]HJV69854.1 ATP-binding protein [Ideonella sp.]
MPADDFASLFDFLPIGAYRAAPGRRLVRANPALVKLNGCASEAEMLALANDSGQAWYVQPGRRAEFGAQLAHDGRVDGFVSEVVSHKTGERRWVSECAHEVRAEDGTLCYYEGTIEDITERVQAEQVLARSRERDAMWKLALEATGDGVWDWYVQTGEEIYSRRLREMYGWADDEIDDLSIELDRRTHPDDIAGMLQAREDHFSGRAPSYTNEHRVQCKDGSWKWILTRGMVIARDEAGRPLRMIGTHTDITERKQAEALRQSRDRAEAANRAQTEFLSRVSHELRTPLNAILGFSQLLEMDSMLAPRHLAWTHAILRSGNHLLALVDDVLDLSSVQTGQLRVDARPVDLLALIDECWVMLAGRAAQAGLVFEPHIDRTQPWMVQADPTRLRQVLTNLLSNAVKYNRLHGTLRLEAEHQAGDGGAIALRVIDTGRGLDPDQRARLFTPFDRLGVQRSGIEGTGLGLALSQQLARAMGGAIEVESEPGQGSCFTLVLPAAD